MFRRGAPPDATYTFKHALVQDAAYDSLLKSKRSQLHAQIAETLERNFLDTVRNEPDLLAHHFTHANLYGRAVPYWIAAGRKAMNHVALAEAIGHLKTALKTIDLLPENREREQQELSARVLLGTAYLAFLGWAAREAVQVLEPAQNLATRLGQNDQLVVIRYYLWFHHAMRCEYEPALAASGQLDELARSLERSPWSAVARFAECMTACWMGDFKHARTAGDELLRSYVAERHGPLVHTFNHDMKAGALSWAGFWLWALGHPDQARQAAVEQRDLARRQTHPFNLCWSLTGGTAALLLRGETTAALEWTAEAYAVADDNGLGFMRDVMVPYWAGYSLIEQGNFSEGEAQHGPALKVWRGTGALQMIPFSNMMLSKALIGLRRLHEAASLLDEALELASQTGHRIAEAEIHRVRGELELRQPKCNLHAAQACFMKALRVAQSQNAKGWELRAATSLARLWKHQGQTREAYELLASVYNWFTEGFDTKDLKEAKALLEELG